MAIVNTLIRNGFSHKTMNTEQMKTSYRFIRFFIDNPNLFFITKIFTEFLESSALNKKLVINLFLNAYAI